jgi:hypothetical protein
MTEKKTVQEMANMISEMGKLVEGLYAKSADNQSITRNLDRISANLNLLKIGVNDVLELI